MLGRDPFQTVGHVEGVLPAIFGNLAYQPLEGARQTPPSPLC